MFNKWFPPMNIFPNFFKALSENRSIENLMSFNFGTIQIYLDNNRRIIFCNGDVPSN